MNETRELTHKEFCRLGGSTKSPAKAAASRENGKKGGRPRKVRYPDIQAPTAPRLHDSCQFDSAERDAILGSEGADAVLPESA